MTDDRELPTPLSVFEAAADAVARADGPDAALAILVGLAAEATGASSGVVFVQDPDRSELEVAAAFGWADADLAELAAAVADEDHPLAVAAGDRHAAVGREAESAGGTVVAADLPLIVLRDGGEIGLGVASFAWPAGHEIDADDASVLSALADLMAVTVDRAQVGSLLAERGEWIERLANTDALTGLANARVVEQVLELEVARAGRQATEVSVVVFDIDAFEALNAAAGSRAGDEVLRRVASVLTESVRIVDTVARYGGDEFLIVAPGPAGATVARRVIEAVAALPPVAGRAISVSAGVARYPDDAGAALDLIGAAAQVLAEARAGGGGQIVEAGRPGPGGGPGG